MTEEEYDSIFNYGLVEEDKKKLEEALALVKSTVVYQRYACEDPDWHLCSAVDGIVETLAGRWWH